eukprot:TRINITY_DN20945_c0_g2_i2.p1 TRINITY_DN20945_c0_g2~~TRINITY_DN20945_c0_g2_i2.p1  ORF type:complete len:140 (-),score=26.60 TRINITY_DN20945_c0_g2_i2:411-830(-)
MRYAAATGSLGLCGHTASEPLTSFAGDAPSPAAASVVQAQGPGKDALPLDIHVIIKKASGNSAGQVSIANPRSLTGADAVGKAAAAAAGKPAGMAAPGPPAPQAMDPALAFLAAPPRWCSQRFHSRYSQSRPCKGRDFL